MTTPASDWLTRKQAAARLGVHYNTLRLWEKRGRLHPERVKVGDREEVRLDPRELDQIARQSNIAAPLTLSAERLWKMYQDALKEAQQARERVAALEAELRLLGGSD